MLARYFHAEKAEIHITNKRIGCGTLLIIGDSYTHCMERFFAESYRQVYKIDPRSSKSTLGKFLCLHAVDDVLIIAASETSIEKTLDFLR